MLKLHRRNLDDRRALSCLDRSRIDQVRQLGILHQGPVGMHALRCGANGVMATVILPRIAPELKPTYEIKVDLDERAFLFPSGKSLNQLAFLSDGTTIFVEGSFQFNQARTPPRFLTLNCEDAKELAHKLIEAVYYAKPQLVITSAVKITITVAANGYHLQVGDLNQSTELFLGTGCIWRVCQALLRTIDLISPIESN